jgi:hypothetical protein
VSMWKDETVQMCDCYALDVQLYEWSRSSSGDTVTGPPNSCVSNDVRNILYNDALRLQSPRSVMRVV